MDTASPLADTRRARNFASLYEPPRINGNFTGKHILTVKQFSRKDLQILFDASTSLKKRSRNPPRVMRACRPVSAAKGCTSTPMQPKPCCRRNSSGRRARSTWLPAAVYWMVPVGGPAQRGPPNTGRRWSGAGHWPLCSYCARGNMANSTEAAVANALLDIGAFRHAPDSPVTFRSGIMSPVYVDNRRLINHPPQWQTVIDGMSSLIHEAELGFDVIAGIAVGGVPHSSALAFTLGCPAVFVRKEAKGHGLQSRIDGGEVAGRHVLLVEDMITTGGSSLSGVTALRAAGAVVTDCLSITSFDLAEAQQAFFSERVRLWPLAGFACLLSLAAERGLIDAATRAQLEAWQREPRSWQPQQSL